ncbi:MAG: Ig-like domain-containing protein [Oscillospiraceae bacterium]|jgi:uncharacterized protein YjdB|nr:Ig-like domain-containing protein [Oscillospiraceae bacterium]
MKRRILSLTLTLAMLLTMIPIGGLVQGLGVAAAEGTPGASVTERTQFDIYWTRSVEYSPWLTETGDPDTYKLPNPEATNYAAATANYLSSDSNSATYYGKNPYIYNLVGNKANNPNNDLEDVLNDNRMRIAYVDPRLKALQDQANSALTALEEANYKADYAAWVTAMKAGTAFTPTYDFEGLKAKRLAVLNKIDAGILTEYEKDYNKGTSLIYADKYIWDGGYMPIDDPGTTAVTPINNEPPALNLITSNENTQGSAQQSMTASLSGDVISGVISFYGYALSITVYTGNVLSSGKNATGTVVFTETAAGGYYSDSSNHAYSATLSDGGTSPTGYTVIVRGTAGNPDNWVGSYIPTGSGSAISPVTDYALTPANQTLNIEKRSDSSIKKKEYYYISPKSFAPPANVEITGVTYAVSPAGIVDLNTTSSSIDPYHISVVAAGAGMATITATLTTTDGATVIRDTTVTVAETAAPAETYDPTYGIYCRGRAPEIGNNGTQERKGAASAQGQWASWTNWTTRSESNIWEGPEETLRRFTGYVYIPEEAFATESVLYFSALNDVLLAGDDSFAIVINGVPFLRSATHNLNNYVNDNGINFDADHTAAIITPGACTGCSLGNTLNPKWTEYSYGGIASGPWHTHLDNNSKFNATQYLKSGVNRIDIIAGDVAQGGGLSRLHLFSTNDDVFNAAMWVSVRPYSDPECTQLIDTPQNVGTVVYYKYTVTNYGEADLTNVHVVDAQIGVDFTRNTYSHYTNSAHDVIYDENKGPYGLDPYNTGSSPDNLASTGVTINNYNGLTQAEKDNLNLLARIEPGDHVDIIIPVASITGKMVGTVINKPEGWADGGLYDTSSTIVSFISNNITNDFAVIDYGLPVTIPVLSNDNLSGTNDIAGVKVGGEGDYDNAFATGSDLTGYTASANGTFGTIAKIAVASADDVLKYTPTAIVNDVDEFVYAVEASGSVASAKVSVVPASSVYYEDSFANITIAQEGNFNEADVGLGSLVYSGAWITEGSADSREQAYDNNAHYGYDAVYDVSETNSGGSAHYTGNAINYTALNAQFGTSLTAKSTLADIFGLEKQHPGIYSAATKQVWGADKFADTASSFLTFKFKGTGLDIISRCTADAGAMTVSVYNANGVTFAEDTGKAAGTAVKTVSMNNIFGGDGIQSQIPTVTIKDLAWGEYVVQIEVKKMLQLASAGNKVYIDALRIYDPINPTDSRSYYNADEKSAITYKIRDLIINDINLGGGAVTPPEESTQTVGDNTVRYIPAAFYLDDNLNGKEGDANDAAKFAKFGPKNELYLQSKYDGFVFDYDASNASTNTLQFDAKLIYINGGSTAPEILRVTNLTTGATDTAEVSSATEMFYDFRNLLGTEKVAKFLVQKETEGNILSLTNIKVPNISPGSVLQAFDFVVPDTVTIIGNNTMYATTSQVLTYDYTVASGSKSDALIFNTKWEIASGSEFASIAQDGTLSATAPGAVTVKITLNDGVNGVAPTVATFAVTVNPAPKYVESLVIKDSDNNTSGSKYVNSSFQLTETIAPPEATIQLVTWESLDPSIASVNVNGLVTVYDKTQTVTIRATTTDGTAITAVYTLTVIPRDVVYDTVLSAVPNPESIDVYPTPGTSQIIVTMKGDTLPHPESEVLDQSYTFVSQTPQFATVNITTGVVTAVAEGTAIIRVYNGDSSSYVDVEIEVEDSTPPTVYTNINSLTASETTIDRNPAIGNTVQLAFTTTNVDDQSGAFLTNYGYDFVSSNTAVATVSAAGLVTAGTTTGTATITLKNKAPAGALYSEKTVTITVDYTPPTIALSPTELEFTVGDEDENVTATLANAIGWTLTWYTSDSATATVGAGSTVSGTSAATAVSPVAVGTANVYAKLTYGALEVTSGNVEVTVESGQSVFTEVPVDIVLISGEKGYYGTVVGLTEYSHNSGPGVITASASTTLTTAQPLEIAIQTNPSYLLWSGDAIADNFVRLTLASNGTVTYAGYTVNHNGGAAWTGTASAECWYNVTLSNGRIVVTQRATAGTGGTVELVAPKAPKSVTITGTPDTIYKVNGSGTPNTTTLTANILPVDATADTEITWTASPSGIVSFTPGVGATKTFTAAASGDVTITATTANGKSNTFVIHVIDNTPVNIYPNNAIADSASKTLDVYTGSSDPKTWTLTASLTYPTHSGAYDVEVATLHFESSNTAVATVNSTGTITAVATGTATITIKNDASPQVAIGSVAVTVVNTTPSIAVTNTGATTIDYYAGNAASDPQSSTITAAITNDNSYTVEWSASPADKVSFSTTTGSSTTVTALAGATGSVTITATLKSGGTTLSTDTTSIAVKDTTPTLADSLTVTTPASKTLKLLVGNESTIITQILPSNTSDQTLDWSSSAAGVATVSGTGKVTAVAAGTATITVATVDGSNKSDTVTVTVVAAPTVAIATPASPFSFEVGDTQAFTTTTITNGDGWVLAWASSDASKASFSGNTLTAVAAGTTNVTAKLTNTEFPGVEVVSAPVAVTVTALPTVAISSPTGAQNLNIGSTLGFAATTSAGAQASGWTLKFVSSDEAKAAFDIDNETLTGLAVGTTTVTAVLEKAGKTTIVSSNSIVVTVKDVGGAPAPDNLTIILTTYRTGSIAQYIGIDSWPITIPSGYISFSTQSYTQTYTAFNNNFAKGSDYLLYYNTNNWKYYGHASNAIRITYGLDGTISYQAYHTNGATTGAALLTGYGSYDNCTGYTVSYNSDTATLTISEVNTTPAPSESGTISAGGGTAPTTTTTTTTTAGGSGNTGTPASGKIGTSITVGTQAGTYRGAYGDNLSANGGDHITGNSPVVGDIIVWPVSLPSGELHFWYCKQSSNGWSPIGYPGYYTDLGPVSSTSWS